MEVGGAAAITAQSLNPTGRRLYDLYFQGALPVTSSQVTTSIIHPELGPLPLSEPQDPGSFNEFGSSDPRARSISLSRFERYKGGFQKYFKILQLSSDLRFSPPSTWLCRPITKQKNKKEKIMTEHIFRIEDYKADLL